MPAFWWQKGQGPAAEQRRLEMGIVSFFHYLGRGGGHHMRLTLCQSGLLGLPPGTNTPWILTGSL